MFALSVHYCEYLVGLINRNGIDPAEVMVERELILLLEKEEKEIPRKKNQETSNDYRHRLLQVFPSKKAHKIQRDGSFNLKHVFNVDVTRCFWLGSPEINFACQILSSITEIHWWRGSASIE